MSARWVRGEGGGFKNARDGQPAHDATVTMPPFRTCPTGWHHGYGGGRLAFSLLCHYVWLMGYLTVRPVFNTISVVCCLFC